MWIHNDFIVYKVHSIHVCLNWIHRLKLLQVQVMGLRKTESQIECSLMGGSLVKFNHSRKSAASEGVMLGREV